MRRLVVHLGCSKTGTSSLQAGLWESVDALSAAGVGLPFRDREEHLEHLLRPLGWVSVEAFAGPHDATALAALPGRIRATPGDVLFASNEDLAELDRRGAEAIATIAAEAGTELQLMLTVRGWAPQLPSEYQQFLKHRMTLTFPEFLDAVRARPAGEPGVWAERFRARQDPLAILDTFAGLVPAERIHVVPITSEDPEAIFRATGGIVGVDHTLIRRPGTAVNTSFGSVEAEVLRRVALALGRSLPAYRDFARAIRRPFVRGVLPHGASPRLRLPPEHRGWVEECAATAIGRLRAEGYRIHGELDSLRPAESQVAPVPEVSEADVARVAVETLARYAVYQRERAARSGAGAVAEAPAGRPPWWRRRGRR